MSVESETAALIRRAEFGQIVTMPDGSMLIACPKSRLERRRCARIGVRGRREAKRVPVQYTYYIVPKPARLAPISYDPPRPDIAKEAALRWRLWS